MIVEGMATVLPFHRLIVRDQSFVDEPFRVHTRWIETEWENTVAPHTGTAVADSAAEERTTIVVEVGGKRLEVSLPASMGTVAAGPVATAKAGGAKRSSRSGHASAVSGNALASPDAGDHREGRGVRRGHGG